MTNESVRIQIEVDTLSLGTSNEMSAPFLIVDGYNLMHAAGLARATYGPGDLAKKRHELLVKLSRRLSADERSRCTVVFDAIDAPPNLPRRHKHGEMMVIFAEPGHEADEVIEALISEHSAPRRLTVVSSDHRLQNAVRRRRGQCVDSDDFLKKIESPHRQIGPVPTPSSNPRVEEDLEFWVSEFNQLSPDAIDRELDLQSGKSKTDWENQIEQLQKRISDPKGLDDWLNEKPERDSK